MTEMVAKPRIALAIVALSSLAVFMRFNNLTIWPLSLDESYSAFGASKGFAFIWNVLPEYETHPPLYSALLRCWMLVAGTSIMALRSIGAIVGLMTLPIIWYAAREIALLVRRDRITVPLCALAFAAVMPSLVDLARFVRPYYLLTFVYAVSVWALMRVTRIHRLDGKLAPLAGATYLTCLPLMVWLHNLGGLFAFALVLALLILIGPVTVFKQHWRAFLACHVLAFLAALPALLILFDQAPTWTTSTWLFFVPSYLPLQIPMIYGWPTSYTVPLCLILIILGLRSMGSDAKQLGVALLVLATLPVLLSIALSLTIAPVFLVRTLVPCSVPMLMLIALGADEGLWARTGLALLCVFTGILLVRGQQLEPDQDWYGAVRWLTPKLGPHDLVYAYPNEGALPLRSALGDLGRVAQIRAIPSEVPAHDPAGWYPSGNRGVQSLTPERLAEIANDPVSQRTPVIWLFRLGKRPFDMNDEAQKALGKSRSRIAHFEVRAIDIVGFAKPAPSVTPK